MFRLIFVTVFISIRIRSVSVFNNIRFCFRIRVSDSNFDFEKKNIKMNMIKVVSNRIRSVFIPSPRTTMCALFIVHLVVAIDYLDWGWQHGD